MALVLSENWNIDHLPIRSMIQAGQVIVLGHNQHNESF